MKWKSAVLAMLLCAGWSGSSQAVERWQTILPPSPMPRSEHTGYAPINGIQMYYAFYGHGSPILLIHLGGGNGDQWAAEIPGLSRRHTVIVADSRGHGRSTRTGIPFSYALMASDYLALLDYLHISRVALVGASDGAIIGLEIAIHHPERLTKLFAQGANSTPDGARPDALDPAASRLVSAQQTVDYQRLSRTPDQYASFQSALNLMWTHEPQYTAAELSSIRVPTAIVVADHDEWIRPDHAQYLASAIPGATLVILANVSHYAALQDPQGYVDAVLSFLDRADVAPTPRHRAS